MTDKEKLRISKKLLQKNEGPIKINYFWKRQGEIKIVGNYYKKKNNKCKNILKIKIKKNCKKFKWL